MPRTTGLIAIAIGAAAAFAAATAQPGALPECNRQLIEEVLSAGRIPSFRGCTVVYARDRIRQTFGERYEVEVHPVGGPAAARPITIVRQLQADRLIHLYAVASQPPPAPPQQPPVIVQTQPAPPPPPPPPPRPAEVFTTVAPGVGANPTQPTGEIYQNVTFSILDAAPVEAGGTLIFIVRREGDDGRAHQVNFKYSGGGLLTDRQEFIRFEPGGPSQQNLEVKTALVQSGDGDNTVRVDLQAADDGSFIGEPSAASGTIREAPPPPAVVTYSITPDEAVSRGNDLRFTVSRTQSAGTAQIPYRIMRNGTPSTTDDTHDRIEFADGQADVPLVVPADRYEECDETVTVILDDGTATSTNASFSDPPPAWCYPSPPWWQVLLDWLGDNLPLALGGLALGTALVLDKIFKPFVRVHPSCTITPGTPAFRALEQPVSRWPETRADVVIEPGELHVTQPLPRSERPDG